MHIIHTCRPNYNDTKDDQSCDRLHGVLRQAYSRSLDLANQSHVRQICFSLISGGAFIGSQSVKVVVEVGLSSIHDWAIKNGADLNLHSPIVDIIWVAHNTDTAWAMVMAAEKLLRNSIKATVI
jgi:O-acetyl-ADP-ribose deacetylase (regulator of RNase III)